MKRGPLIALVAAGTAVVIAAGTAWWLLARPASIEDAAAAYLTALESGDVDAITALHEAPLPGDAEAMMTDAFTGAAAYVTAARVEDIGDDGTVRASAQLAEEPVSLTFRLEESADGWRVSDDLATLQATTTIGDAVWVGDALVPADGSGVALLAALYDVAPAPRALLEGGASVAVTNDAGTNEGITTIAVDATLSPDATTRAQAQLDDYIASCTQEATSVPQHCGIRLPWAADLTTLTRVAFRVEQQPVFAFAPDAASFAATGGALVATATGSSRAGGEGSFTYRADDWTLRGTAVFTGDELVLAVD